MGALTSDRSKRPAEFPSSLSFGFGYSETPVPKRLKLSSLSSYSSFVSPEKTSKSLVSRISLYPRQVTPISREIHAPCPVVNGFTGRLKKFGSSGSGIIRQRSDFTGGMMDKHQKALLSNYNHAKEAALGSCRYVDFGKGKEVVEVIDVDKEDTGKDENAASGDSGVEELGTVEDGRDEPIKSGEAQEIMNKYRELDIKSGKMLDSLSLNQRSDGLDVRDRIPLHKKLLLASAEKYDSKLRRLSFDIELEEKRRVLHQQLRPAKKAEEDVPEHFRPLTEDEEELVADALSNGNRRKVLVTHEDSNIMITGEVLQCLRPHAWLNDEVINLYLELLKERERREPKKFLKCHFFNTFFYKKLISGRTGYDYKSVRRWTTQRKLGYSLLECDKIFVPVHKEVHWCLAVINKKEGKFQYLDSLGGIDKQVMGILGKYIVDEVKDKSGKEIDVTSWKQEYVKDLPNQENGYDCGVFMIKYADFYSRDIGLCFNQEHMPYFRLRTAKEILRLRAD